VRRTGIDEEGASFCGMGPRIENRESRSVRASPPKRVDLKDAGGPGDQRFYFRYIDEPGLS
jgi:hypothetical protein